MNISDLHSKTDITKTCRTLNDCERHGCKPKVFKIKAGKKKQTYYVVWCESDNDRAIVTPILEDALTAWNIHNLK